MPPRCDRDPPDVVEDGETPYDRPVDPPDADPSVEQIEDRDDQKPRSAPAHGKKAIHHQRKARSRRAMAQMRSVIEPIVGSGITTGSSARGAVTGSRAHRSHRAGDGNVAHAPVSEGRIAVADQRFVGDARLGVLLFQQRVVERALLTLDDLASGSFRLPKVKTWVGQAAWQAVRTLG